MRIPFAALLCVPVWLAAAQTAEFDKLVELARLGGGNIRLDAHSYELLTSPKRNWSSSIHFTAMDKRRKCAPCTTFDPAWTAVAKAWNSVSKSTRDEHFFATIDFDDASTIFQKLGLQSAPVVFNFPATQGPRAPASGRVEPSKYDFSHGFDPAPLAESLSTFTPIPIPYREPVDYMKFAAIAAGALAFGVAIPFLAPVLKNRWTWAAVTIMVSLVMTSGYMFTRIRGSPWSGGDGTWIAPGYSNQYGQEVHVITILYGLLASSFLMLTLAVPRQRSPTRQRIQVYLWSAVIVIIYSILVGVFKIKNRGYPFGLLF